MEMLLNVGKGLLGNKKKENYKNFIDKLLKAYELLGCFMCLKTPPFGLFLEPFGWNKRQTRREVSQERWKEGIRDARTYLCF